MTKMQIEGAQMLVDRDPQGRAARVQVWDASGRAVLSLEVVGAQDSFRVTHTAPVPADAIRVEVAA